MVEPVIITDQVQTELGSIIGQGNFSSIAVLVDENTFSDCLPLIRDCVPGISLINIHPGEKHKNLETCEYIWNEMTFMGMDRKGLLINLGGGVIGDMGGFCAATYKRGIKFINVPTTLLSQVDASVGGKLGIDFHGYKNHIGLFAMPYSVVIDVKFLETLPSRQLRSGFAEVIKHCLIADPKEWIGLCRLPFEEQPWKHHVQQSVKIKSDIVRQDPLESGLRKVLNFGHTLGHALETYFLDNPETEVLHGEAVAAGMICELFLSEELSGLNSSLVNTAINYILTTFGKLPLRKEDCIKIIPIARQDKKNVNGELKFTLLEDIGKAIINVSVPGTKAEKALVRYCDLRTA